MLNEDSERPWRTHKEADNFIAGLNSQGPPRGVKGLPKAVVDRNTDILGQTLVSLAVK